MFIGAITNSGIDLTLDKGIGRMYPWITSLLISFLSKSDLAVAPLWLPKVNASSRSLSLCSLLISSYDHLLPFMRIDSIVTRGGGNWIPSWVLAASKILIYNQGGSFYLLSTFCQDRCCICSEFLDCAMLLTLIIWRWTPGNLEYCKVLLSLWWFLSNCWASRLFAIGCLLIACRQKLFERVARRHARYAIGCLQVLFAIGCLLIAFWQELC